MYKKAYLDAYRSKDFNEDFLKKYLAKQDKRDRRSEIGALATTPVMTGLMGAPVGIAAAALIQAARDKKLSNKAINVGLAGGAAAGAGVGGLLDYFYLKDKQEPTREEKVQDIKEYLYALTKQREGDEAAESLEKRLGKVELPEEEEEKEAAEKEEQEKEEELPCPGSKIRSKGKGLGKGVGQAKGPLGIPIRDKNLTKEEIKALLKARISREDLEKESGVLEAAGEHLVAPVLKGVDKGLSLSEKLEQARKRTVQEGVPELASGMVGGIGKGLKDTFSGVQDKYEGKYQDLFNSLQGRFPQASGLFDTLKKHPYITPITAMLIPAFIMALTKGGRNDEPRYAPRRPAPQSYFKARPISHFL